MCPYQHFLWFTLLANPYSILSLLRTLYFIFVPNFVHLYHFHRISQTLLKHIHLSSLSTSIIFCHRNRYQCSAAIPQQLFLYCYVHPHPLSQSTLSSRIGKVVASHAEGCKVAGSDPGCGWAAPIYTMHEALRGYWPWGWGVRPVNLISDAIVRSWLWSTATRCSQFGYFNRFLQVVTVDNLPHILW